MDIIYDDVDQKSREGKLLEFLKSRTLPWTHQFTDTGFTFLHFASYGKNDLAAVELLNYGLDVNAKDDWNVTPFQLSVDNVETCGTLLVQIFIAAGADMRFKLRDEEFILEFLLSRSVPKIKEIHFECAKLFLCNGFRLSQLSDQRFLIPRLVEVETKVLNCRDAIVVLLGLKKRRLILPKLDRFLVQQELAVAIWTTRSD